MDQMKSAQGTVLCVMAWHNIIMNPEIKPMQHELLDKHYLRKHGANAYYGQKK